MELWHGSRDIVRVPRPELCRPHNDYGPGFYCTQDAELAKEWACSHTSGGFANRYELDERGLFLLDLDSGEYTVLNWLALLAHNRRFRMAVPVGVAGLAYLEEHFSVDIENCDIIRGYRADDSYFSFARAFVSNQISVGQLACAMRLGKLGIQVMLKSELAFARVRYVGCESASRDVYYPRRAERDMRAREQFRAMAGEFDPDGLYMADILREGIRNDDERLHA